MPSRHLGPCSILLGALLLAYPTQAQNASRPLPVGGPTSEKSRSAPPKDAAVAVLENWVLGVSQGTLGNGLRVVMAPDPESPTVSVCVTYDVGSRNEILGQSGFAHLFEHMMFQGSRNVAKGQHFQLITARGGSSTAPPPPIERTTFKRFRAANSSSAYGWKRIECDGST
ncbi:MAG: insulinase family protein [Polyangiaceae bacterium]